MKISKTDRFVLPLPSARAIGLSSGCIAMQAWLLLSP
jgi:hypothetical protein